MDRELKSIKSFVLSIEKNMLKDRQQSVLLVGENTSVGGNGSDNGSCTGSTNTNCLNRNQCGDSLNYGTCSNTGGCSGSNNSNCKCTDTGGCRNTASCSNTSGCQAGFGGYGTFGFPGF